MIEIANGYGAAVGITKWIELRRQDGIARYILQAIDMGCYSELQRGLLTRDWGRKQMVTRYRETIKLIRDANAKRRKV